MYICAKVLWLKCLNTIVIKLYQALFTTYLISSQKLVWESSNSDMYITLGNSAEQRKNYPRWPAVS